jgi:hypothetical protein
MALAIYSVSEAKPQGRRSAVSALAEMFPRLDREAARPLPYHARFSVANWFGLATEAGLLPQVITVPCVLNLKDDDRHDGRHDDGSSHYRY